MNKVAVVSGCAETVAGGWCGGGAVCGWPATQSAHVVLKGLISLVGWGSARYVRSAQSTNPSDPIKKK